MKEEQKLKEIGSQTELRSFEVFFDVLRRFSLGFSHMTAAQDLILKTISKNPLVIASK